MAHSERFVDQAFLDNEGAPTLARSALLFVDLLGVRAVSKNSPAEGLLALEQATRRMFRDFLAPDSPWPSAFFSDTLVIASPLIGPDPEEAALGGLIIQAAYLQLNLIEADWFLRGGLALGDVHVRDGLVYGPALIEAYDLESRHAVHPRIVLSGSAAESQREALQHYAHPESSPENLLLLRDDDGFTFIDYLSLLFDEPEDPRPALAMHRDRLMSRLDRERDNRRVWEKYRWIAEYHNHTCQTRVAGDSDLLVPESAAVSQFRAFHDAAGSPGAQTPSDA